MKVVVTGGAGFIGSNLCRHLSSLDGIDHVLALDDLSSGFAENLTGVNAELRVGSFMDDATLDEVLRDTTSVVHLGARPSVPRSIADPMASHEANATGTLRVLEAMRRHDVGHIVVASSSSVYGANATLPKTESMTPMPMSPYAVSKLAAEQYAVSHGAVFGLSALAFRFFNVYGPGQRAGHAYAAVVPAFVDAALRGEPLPIHGDGSQTRDFTYVDDVTAVIGHAVRGNIGHRTPVNLAFGGRYSLLDVIADLEAILGQPIERAHQDNRAGDVPHSQADQTTLRDLFPDLTPAALRDGLEHTVAWHRQRI